MIEHIIESLEDYKAILALRGEGVDAITDVDDQLRYMKDQLEMFKYLTND